MDPNLTKRQAECLDAIRGFAKDHGYTPTIREVMDIMQIKSSSTVFGYMKSLQKKGFMRRVPGDVRLQLIDKEADGQRRQDRDMLLKMADDPRLTEYHDQLHEIALRM